MINNKNIFSCEELDHERIDETKRLFESIGII